MSNSNGKAADAADSPDLDVVETTTLQPYKVMVSWRFTYLELMTAAVWAGALLLDSCLVSFFWKKHGNTRHADRSIGGMDNICLPQSRKTEGSSTNHLYRQVIPRQRARQSSSLLIRRDENTIQIRSRTSGAVRATGQSPAEPRRKRFYLLKTNISLLDNIC
jgi:hypothetical protein